jgi:hypothetical protein
VAWCTPFQCDVPTLALYVWFSSKPKPRVLATRRLVIRTWVVCNLRAAICHKETLRSWFYLIECATRRTKASKRPIFKRKKGSRTLVWPYSSNLSLISSTISWHCTFNGLLSQNQALSKRFAYPNLSMVWMVCLPKLEHSLNGLLTQTWAWSG